MSKRNGEYYVICYNKNGVKSYVKSYRTKSHWLYDKDGVPYCTRNIKTTKVLTKAKFWKKSYNIDYMVNELNGLESCNDGIENGNTIQIYSVNVTQRMSRIEKIREILE